MNTNPAQILEARLVELYQMRNQENLSQIEYWQIEGRINEIHHLMRCNCGFGTDPEKETAEQFPYLKV